MGIFDDLIVASQKTTDPRIVDYNNLPSGAPGNPIGIETPKGNIVPMNIVRRIQAGLAPHPVKGQPQQPLTPQKISPAGSFYQGSAKGAWGINPQEEAYQNPNAYAAGKAAGDVLRWARYGLEGLSGSPLAMGAALGGEAAGNRFIDEAANQGKPYGEAARQSITPGIVNSILGAAGAKILPWMVSKGVQGASRLAPGLMNKIIAPLGREAASPGGIDQGIRMAYDKFQGARAAAAVKGKGIFDDLSQGMTPEHLAEANTLYENPHIPFTASQEARDFIPKYEAVMKPITEENIAKGRIEEPLEGYIHRATKGSTGMMNTVMNKMPSEKARVFDTTEEAKQFYGGLQNAVESDPFLQNNGITMQTIRRMAPNELTGLRTMLPKTPYDTPDVLAARTINQNAKHTINLPDRKGLQNKIADKLYGTGAADKQRQAQIIMGLPGTGKTNVANPFLNKGYLLIDPDKAKELIPEYKGGAGADTVHEESSRIADMITERGMANGDNMVIPTVGSNLRRLQEKIGKLKANGYDVHVTMIPSTPAQSAENAIGRWKNKGRFVDPDYILNHVGLKPEQNYDTIIKEGGLASHEIREPGLSGKIQGLSNSNRGPTMAGRLRRPALDTTLPGGRTGPGSGKTGMEAPSGASTQRQATIASPLLKFMQDKGMDESDLKKLPFWLGRQPLENPALSAGLSSRALAQANATEEFANTLKGLQDKHGPIFDPRAINNPNYTTNYDIAPGLMDKHFYMGGDEGATILGKQKIPLRKDYAKVISQVLGKPQNWDDPNEFVRAFNEINKTGVFYNPLGPHQINIGSNAMQAVPGRLDIATGEAGKLVRQNPQLWQEALKSGFRSPRAQTAERALRSPLEGEPETTLSPFMQKSKTIADKWRGVQNKLLWNHVDDVGLGVWKHYRDTYMKKGFGQEEAGRMASEVANDVIGMTSGARTPMALRNAWVRAGLMIPQWLNTGYRKYAGAVLPGQIFKSFGPKAQRALQDTYAENLGSGFNQAAFTGNLLNKALSGHFAFENDKRNQPSFANPGGTLETAWRDPVSGKVQTIGNPFFKHLSIPQRTAADIQKSGLPTRSMHTWIRALASQVMNKDLLTGKQLTYPGEPLKEKAIRRGEQFASDVSPLGIGNVIREQTTQGLPKWQRALSMVLPTYLGETHGAGPGFDKLMQMNRQRNPGSWQGPDEPWVLGVDRAIQKGDYKRATQLAMNNGKDAKWYINHLEKLMTPVSHSLRGIPGFSARLAGEEPKGHDFFGEFWPKLSKDEQQGVIDAWKREEQKRNTIDGLKEQ